MLRRSLPLILAINTLLIVSVAAEDWLQWRGPTGTGVSAATKLPTTWGNDKNILWSTKLPGMGGATPVIVGDNIVLTTELEDGKLGLICFDKKDGKQRWDLSLSNTKSRRARGDEGNGASASPCSDGTYVYAFVGSGDFVCADLNGKQRWAFNAQERYGNFKIQFGISSTPVLHEGKLYWQLMHDGGQFVICINAADGKDVWKVDRPSDGHSENPHSYASAQLWKKGDQAYLVVHGNDYTTGHDLKDGHEIWRLMGLNPKEKYHPTQRFVASPAISPDLIVIPTAKNGPVVAVKPDAQGKFDHNTPYVQWRRTRETPDVPCPLIHDGLVYLCRENGVLICLDAADGKEYYNQRIHSARYRASPILADGKVYSTARDGTVTVTKAGKQFEVLSVNKLDDQISASPIVESGRVYLRGFDKLYCIGEK